MSPTLELVYRKAVADLGRQELRLNPVEPTGGLAGEAAGMLVLIGGWIFDSGPQDAWAFLLGEGRHWLGQSHPESAFPKTPGRPKLFEGTQCELEIGETSRLVKDVSTNGTLVVPAAIARERGPQRLSPDLLEELGRPLPVALDRHDLLLTQYAELVWVPLRGVDRR